MPDELNIEVGDWVVVDPEALRRATNPSFWETGKLYKVTEVDVRGYGIRLEGGDPTRNVWKKSRIIEVIKSNQVVKKLKNICLSSNQET